jgi:hypothetical protein
VDDAHRGDGQVLDDFGIFGWSILERYVAYSARKIVSSQTAAMTTIRMADAAASSARNTVPCQCVTVRMPQNTNQYVTYTTAGAKNHVISRSTLRRIPNLALP